MVFSDETTIVTHALPNRQNDGVWASAADEVPPYDTKKYSSHFKVWGAISSSGKSPLVEIKQPWDSGEYQRCLKVGLLPLARRQPSRWCFQQDGDSAHTSHSTARWFAEQSPHISVLKGWPANSPDLSPIENVWSVLKHRIAIRNPRSLDEARKFAQEEWKKLKLEDFQNSIADVRDRLRRVIKSGGHAI